MKIEPKNNCPLNSFEPCKQLDCAWFIEIHGTHPNTGEPLKDWGCAMAMMPMRICGVTEGAKGATTTPARSAPKNTQP